MFRRTCSDYLVCFLFCTRGYGCGAHPAFPAPSLEGRPPLFHRREKIPGSLGRFAPRECGAAALPYEVSASQQVAQYAPDDRYGESNPDIVNAATIPPWPTTG